MRDLKINQVKTYYSNFVRSEELKDKNDDFTGERRLIYTKPKELQISISIGAGETQAEMFGTRNDFTHIIVTTNIDLPLNEHSILWRDSEPLYLDDGSVDHLSSDFIVISKPKRSLNQVSFGLKERVKGDRSSFVNVR